MGASTITADAIFAAWQRLAPRLDRHDFDEAPLRRLKANPKATCGALAQQVASGAYRPGRLHPVELAKPGGGRRMLLIPPLADRLVQSALATMLSELLEPRFSPSSYAYRPGRGTAQACAQVDRLLADGSLRWLMDADISECFDCIDHAALISQLKAHGLWAHQTAWLLRAFLRSEMNAAPALGLTGPACLWRGLPQGSPLSPVLCNVALHPLDTVLEHHGLRFVRYADDFLVFGDSLSSIEGAGHLVAQVLAGMGLALHPQKTRCIEAADGFSFLGKEFGAGTHSGAPAHRVPTNMTPSLPAANPAQGHPAIEEPAPATDANATPRRTTREVSQDEVSKATGQEFSDSSNLQGPQPLLRTLYLLEPHCGLDRQANQLVVHTAGQDDIRIPAARLHQIMAFGATSLSSGAIALCLEHGIPVMILSGRGRYFGLVDPLRLDNMQAQRAQFRVLDQPDRALQIARAIVHAKVGNSLVLLRRWNRYRPIENASEVFDQLHLARNHAREAATAASLRGIEGSAAAAYWKALGGLLAPVWRFEGRRRQPPPDPVNSMLSYGYTILYYNLLSLVSARGLNPFAGFYHATRSGHHALVSDLLEEFRGPIVDALVMDMVQNGRVKPDDFSWPETDGDACLISTAARRSYVHAFEAKLNSTVRHVRHGLMMDWRRIMDGQVLELVQSLQDPVLDYQPYIIKP